MTIEAFIWASPPSASPAQALAERVYALAKRQGRQPSTLSRELFGNGLRLGQIRGGSSMTLDTYARVERLVSEMEAAAAKAA